MNQYLQVDIRELPAFRLDISGLPRGIDNYHIDVRLSPVFCSHLEDLCSLLINRQTASAPASDITLTPEAQALRESYVDMLTVLLHRIKTEYSLTEVGFIQFAVVRQVLETSRRKLDAFIDSLKQRASELRAHGSGKALHIHTQLTRLSSQYNNTLYAINREIFSVFLRSEQRELRDIRRQYFGTESRRQLDILFNPLLTGISLNTPALLAEHYFIWPVRGRPEAFNSLNEALERLLAEQFPGLNTKPLQSDAQENTQTEFHDMLGGLQAGQPYLGMAANSRNMIQEWFCWLEAEDNMASILDAAGRMLTDDAEKTGRLRGWYRRLGQHHRIRQFRRSLLQLLDQHDALRSYLASDTLRRLWHAGQLTGVNPESLMQFFCGQLTFEQLQTRLAGTNRLGEAETRKLHAAMKEIRRRLRQERDATAQLVLCSVARFRLHLKYHRLAHRIFNRLRILESPEDITLAQQAGSLYQLPLADEIEQDEARVAHHTILKADVRGSTTVIDEMDRKGLNAASFFSLRFFAPINQVLPDYGAQKVFIEGDAIILSFLEHENNPHQWYSVAHACGLARAILRIVRTNNQHSHLMGLPPLELGIGICYSDTGPRYLFDESSPIMISSAIGQADRLSSSDWQLRELIRDEYFNVDVLEICSDSPELGKKGQRHLRHNVNGILLEDAAFNKLQSEVALTGFNCTIGGRSQAFFYGRYPDRNGRDRGLLVRRGIVREWCDDGIRTPEADQPPRHYYEVVSNPLVYSMLQDQMETAGKAAGGQS